MIPSNSEDLGDAQFVCLPPSSSSVELSQFCADSDWENEQRNPGNHLNHTLNFNHVLKTFQALQKSVKERRQLILLISTTPRKVKPHNLELKLREVQDPRCPMDTYKSQAEHLVLGSLCQAITDPFQSIRLQKESELGVRWFCCPQTP